MEKENIDDEDIKKPDNFDVLIKDEKNNKEDNFLLSDIEEMVVKNNKLFNQNAFKKKIIIILSVIITILILLIIGIIVFVFLKYKKKDEQSSSNKEEANINKEKNCLEFNNKDNVCLKCFIGFKLIGGKCEINYSFKAEYFTEIINETIFIGNFNEINKLIIDNKIIEPPCNKCLVESPGNHTVFI